MHSVDVAHPSLTLGRSIDNKHSPQCPTMSKLMFSCHSQKDCLCTVDLFAQVLFGPSLCDSLKHKYSVCTWYNLLYQYKDLVFMYTNIKCTGYEYHGNPLTWNLYYYYYILFTLYSGLFWPRRCIYLPSSGSK